MSDTFGGGTGVPEPQHKAEFGPRSRSAPESRTVRRWTTRVVQEFEFDAATADEALAMCADLQAREHPGCLLIARAAYTAERGSNAGYVSNPAAASPVPEEQHMWRAVCANCGCPLAQRDVRCPRCLTPAPPVPEEQP